MPNVPVAYEFGYENARSVILSESEIIKDTVRIVKPPALFGIGPALEMGRPKADRFLLPSN